MAKLEEIAALVAEAGSRNGDVEGVLQRADDEWLVRFPDLDVALELDEPAGRLVLSAEVDAPRPEHRAAVHETLLTYSLLWRDTGGIAAALTADGTVVMLLTLYAAEVTADLLATVLANFAERARLLRTYVARGGEEPQATDALAAIGIRI